MRNANPQIIPLIKEKTLALLMQKSPEQIGMREIAKECGVTATLIYHYYKDKDQLFQAIGLDCILSLNQIILAAAQKKKNPKEKILAAIRAFRDWCFENPRKALLVMQGIKSAQDAPPEVIEEYYACNRTGEKLLQEAIKAGLAKSNDPNLDVGILISGLWGCCEEVILKKTDEKYWNNGEAFTERFLKIWAKSIFVS
ncbi:MAG: TetR/AcrR family transcriptional regulator [Treponema sp.]|nr:TetR/AcrR family transcriptional regulator [Treponema sp.]